MLSPWRCFCGWQNDPAQFPGKQPGTKKLQNAPCPKCQDAHHSLTLAGSQQRPTGPSAGVA